MYTYTSQLYTIHLLKQLRIREIFAGKEKNCFHRENQYKNRKKYNNSWKQYMKIMFNSYQNFCFQLNIWNNTTILNMNYYDYVRNFIIHVAKFIEKINFKIWVTRQLIQIQMMMKQIWKMSFRNWFFRGLLSRIAHFA